MLHKFFIILLVVFLISSSSVSAITKRELSLLFDEFTNESETEFNETLLNESMLFSLAQYNVTYGETAKIWSPIIEPLRITKESFIAMLYDMEQRVNPFKKFITPDNVNVNLTMTTPESAYYFASTNVIYMTDKFQYGIPDKWIIPNSVLNDTPKNNIIKKMAGDCEDKAFLLVSLLRSQGVPPEEVRVGMGKVVINQQSFGHAWAEIYLGGKWVVLESTSGGTYDEQSGTIVYNAPLSYEWFSTYKYPASVVYAYGNDVYFTSFVTNATNVDWYIDQSITQRYFEMPLFNQMILPIVLMSVGIGCLWLGLRRKK